MSEPDVTVVVVPRERFSLALSSLESLLSTVAPERVLYVDGSAPPRVRDALRDAARRRGFRLLRKERFLSPNQARNLGLAEVDTRYVAFVDNDVLFAPGWLEALVTRAERSGAAVVGPLYLQGPPADGVIHMAGGDLVIEEAEGRRRYRAVHREQGRRLAELEERPAAQACDFVELHCLLARRDLLERTSGFDESLWNTREHLDLCLAARALGEEVWLEPAAVVAYVPGPPFALSDLPFFLLRWSEARSLSSLARFHGKWGFELRPAETNLDALKKRRYAFLGRRYRRAVAGVAQGLERRGAGGLLRKVAYPLEGALNRALVVLLEKHLAEPARGHRAASRR